MFEAIFSGIFGFVAKAAIGAVSVVADIIVGSRSSRKADTSRLQPTQTMSDIKDIDKEISNLEKALARSKSERDRRDLEDLKILKKEKYTEFEELKTDEAQSKIIETPDQFSQSRLIGGAEHKLQYHMGVATLNKKCPRCDRPMKVQHKTVDEPEFNDFFWQCTGFYIQDDQCRQTLPFRPFDLSLIHDANVVDIQVSKDDLVTIASEKSVQHSSARRLAEHIGHEDGDILCPEHMVPMILREKRGGEGLPMLDRYHLYCAHYKCGQITKLKSYPQLAAFLRRKEGVGILH